MFQLKPILAAMLVATLALPATTSFAVENDGQYTRACGKAFANLVNGVFNSKRQKTKQTMDSVEDLERLSPAAYRAFEHYVTRFDLEWDPFHEDEVYTVNTAVYVDQLTGDLRGYRIDVDMKGWDEANVRYYFLGTDDDNMELLVDYWDNQSPIRFWHCEGFFN